MSKGMENTPIGKIPADWEVSRIGDITQVSYGLTVNASRRASPERYCYLTIANFSTSGIKLEPIRTIGTLPGDEKYALKQDDILVVEGNGNPELVGRAALWNGEREHMLHQNHLLRLRVKKEVYNARLLVKILNSQMIRRVLAPRINTSSGLHTLNSKELSSCMVPVPPHQEQSKLIKVLDHWDRAIEKTEKLIEAKRELKKGLMQQLLTGKRRFPRFGKSGAGISNDWKTYKLGDLFEERVERNRPDLRLLSITANRGVIDREEVDRKDTSNADKSKYLRIAAGDIGYNTMRMWQGVSALSDLEGIVSPAYTICTPTETIEPVFAAYLFKFPPMVHLFWRYSQGLVAGARLIGELE